MCFRVNVTRNSVLASNVGRLSEIIEHRVDGFLFEKEDVEECVLVLIFTQ